MKDPAGTNTGTRANCGNLAVFVGAAFWLTSVLVLVTWIVNRPYTISHPYLRGAGVIGFVGTVVIGSALAVKRRKGGWCLITLALLWLLVALAFPELGHSE